MTRSEIGMIVLAVRRRSVRVAAVCLWLAAVYVAGPACGTRRTSDPRDSQAVVDGGSACDADEQDAWPTCCTPALCAQVAAACNPETCRCELVPCDDVGAACDPSLLPEVRGPLECGAAPGGSFCFVGASGGEQCPAGIPFCMLLGESSPHCLCGVGCRPFVDDCPAGLVCRLDTDRPPEGGVPAIGQCRLPDERGWCGCGAGMVCAGGRDGAESSCAALECGLAEGAPVCPAGQVCVPIDRLGMVGFCRTPCDPYRLDACNADEICLWAGEEGAAPGYCEPVSTAPLPGLGQACDPFCRASLACVDGLCFKSCARDARDACEGSLAACPAGYSCGPVVQVPQWRVGVCTKDCDPWTTAADCDADTYCAMLWDGQELAGRCMPRGPDRPGLDGRCEGSCDSGLVCRGRCRAICRPGIPGACRAGQHCFSIPEPDTLALLPYGFCERPCEPGGGDCGPGVWCEPRELDPATNRWIGTCDLVEELPATGTEGR